MGYRFFPLRFVHGCTSDSKNSTQESLSSPAPLTSFSSSRRVLSRQPAVSLAILLRLAAQVHKLRGDTLDTESPLRGQESPEEVCSADIGGRVSVVFWRALHATLVIRPLPAIRLNSKGRRCRDVLRHCDYPHQFKLLPGGDAARS